jgi:hypothetical protein
VMNLVTAPGLSLPQTADSPLNRAALVSLNGKQPLWLLTLQR